MLDSFKGNILSIYIAISVSLIVSIAMPSAAQQQKKNKEQKNNSSSQKILVDEHSVEDTKIKSAPNSVYDNDARVEFFKIIQGDPKLVTAPQPTVDIQNPQRKPASNGRELYDFLLGKVEDDPNREFIYFVEVRKFYGNTPVAVRVRDDINGATVYRLKPGEMLKMTERTEPYLDLLRLENKNSGIWKKFETHDRPKPRDLHFYYDWRQSYAINSHHQPVELALRFDAGQSTVTVFNKPGKFDPRDCATMEDLCIGQPDRYAKVFLFDTALLNLKAHVPGQNEFAMYYQVGFASKTPDGKYKYGVGWIRSDQAERQINYLPGSAYGPTGLAGNAFMTEEQRRRQFQSMFFFGDNATQLDSEDVRWSRKIASTGGNSVFDVAIAWDFYGKTSYNKLAQTFLSDELTQYGVTPGIAATAPIFVDVEIEGSLELTVPIASEGEISGEAMDPVYVLKFDQWLMYTAPTRVANTPVRFGVGAYYISLLNAPEDYGFRSLVGLQGQVRLLNKTNYMFLRFGAVGADLKFEFRNREFGIGGGFFLNPAKRFEDWSVFGEISDMDYRSPKTGTVTRFDQIQIGVKKSF